MPRPTGMPLARHSFAHSTMPSKTRDTEFIIPHGSTILLPWDHILCLTRDDSLHELTEAWGLSDK